MSKYSTKAHCATCGRELESEWDDGRIFVKPCKKCLDEYLKESANTSEMDRLKPWLKST